MLRSSEVAHDPYASLRFREYRAFLVAMGAVFAATQIQSAVLGWQVYALTGDPFALGLVGLAEALPFLGLTLVGGWAADRVDRRALSIASLVLVAASGAWLVALSVAPPRTVLPFYAAQALAGVGRAFFRPTAAALGAELVPREHYLNASTWRSSIHHSAMVVGPALGGGLIALGGPGLAYAVVLVLSAVGLLALGAIAPRPRRAAAGGHLVAELTDGIRFVFAHPLLLGAMSLDLFAVLFGGATALLPVFARDVLGVGEVGFGFLRAAPAAGSVLTAFVLALLAVGGALDGVSVVLRSTLVQLETPQEKMGRVAAVNSFFIGSSNELGAFESGAAARLLGTVPSVVFGGAMTLVTVALVAWRAPVLRRLRGLGPADR